VRPVVKVKMKPDDKIKRQYSEAVAVGNHKLVEALNDIYEFKAKENGG
jgi:hypothetical protein